MMDGKSTIFGHGIDQTALDQFASAMELDCVTKGALMPDAHAGYTLPIGAVVATDGVVFPSWVGYDIGCGMCAVRVTCNPGALESADLREQIMAGIYEAVPCGKGGCGDELPLPLLPHTKVLEELVGKRKAARQIGTLGGGNHFIEIGTDEARNVWIIVHSGSRGVGHGVAGRYMALAAGSDKPKEGHFGFLADSALGVDYITDLEWCLEYALTNRKWIVAKVTKVLEAATGARAIWDSTINRNHNHAELQSGMWIHRKGATHAETGMMGVIPGNMRDGSFIVCGLGNPDALWSSSHGAGRVMGRMQAKRTLDHAEFEADMVGVTCRTDASILDESPRAYKDIFEVMKAQDGLVQVLHHVTPIINAKG